jgi:hypothetical protein
MRLEQIRATAHPAGHRIDLDWINPDPAGYPGVRVVRREGTHPVTPDDGVVVAEGEGLARATDTGLRAGTVYYYSLFPSPAGVPDYRIDRGNRAAAMATGPHDLAGQMYELLPAIYHRYDTSPPPAVPAGMTAADRERGQLRRFLDLPGGQLDQLYSLIRALPDLAHLDRVDGRLLPLLGRWIGWKTDHRLEYAGQRSELRQAPALYRTIGLIPTVEATVKRISGWESRTKEYVQNVFLTGQPERLGLRLRRRAGAGPWAEEPFPAAQHVAPAGRPAAVLEADGTVRLVFQTLRTGGGQIWQKTHQDGPGWAPSEPLARTGAAASDPTIVEQGAVLWVFWAVFDEAVGAGWLEYRTRESGVWSAVDRVPGTGPRPCRPWAVVDDAGLLWLFWVERDERRPRLRYSRHAAGVWGAPIDFPLDAGADPRVEAEAFVLFHPTAAPARRFWVFWARQEPAAAPDQTRWTLAYRTRAVTAPDDTGWSAVEVLSALPPAFHDREPAASVAPGGNVELFFSSTRDGSWSLWTRMLDLATETWSAPQAVTGGPHSQRDPLPLRAGTETWLFHRANEPRTYRSQVYGATETVDRRDAGSTTAHTANAGKLALRGGFDDFTTYTYDTGPAGGRGDEDRIARDTIGLFVAPGTLDPAAIAAGIARVRQVLGEFMPLTDRAVFVAEPAVHTEHVYAYERPGTPDLPVIFEARLDSHGGASTAPREPPQEVARAKPALETAGRRDGAVGPAARADRGGTRPGGEARRDGIAGGAERWRESCRTGSIAIG